MPNIYINILKNINASEPNFWMELLVFTFKITDTLVLCHKKRCLLILC